MNENEIVKKRMGRIRTLPVWRARARIGDYPSVAAFCVIVALTLSLSPSAFGAGEQTFDVLQAGTHTYKSVKVTTKAKGYIFIVHSGGMANIKVSELPNEVLEKLGYITAPKPHTTSAALLASHTVARMDTPQFKRFEENLLQVWHGVASATKSHLPPLNAGVVTIAAVLLSMACLFTSYCCMLICQKTGNEPGVLVWLPVLQVLPMLRAASMSPWWFIVFFIPVLNVAGHVVWCLRIAQARHKTVPLAILLLLPVTNLFAFMYLAFSESAAKNTEKLQVEMMALETA